MAETASTSHPGPRLSDADFFARAVDTARPGLEEISAAVARGDFAAARRLFAAEARRTLQPERFFRLRREFRGEHFADLRHDLPRYRVYEVGELVEEPTSIAHRWPADGVGFLLGCSYAFEHALLQAGIRLRHIERGANVPMFRTNRPCVPAGRLHGALVVSMRPLPADQVARAVAITARYPLAHGAPVQVGAPEGLGIADLAVPDWGDPLPLEPGEVPVFWACGVTPQSVARDARPPLMVTHAPGHMFVTDLPIAALET